MSRIAFNGNPLGTGTVTIASPNTNSDRTVTLPDATGTLITNSGTEAISAASLTVSGASTTGSLTVNSNNISAVNSLGFRNRLINGGMVIDQRNAGASVNPSTGAYTLDRWFGGGVHDGVLGVQRVADAPTGFVNSLRVTVSTADASLGATQYARIGQPIEGFNVADFAGGTASAATITFSFWVKSSLTGTFGGYIANGDETRIYIFQYTINAASTWEQKTVTLTLATNGTWATDNSAGMRAFFSLGAGSSYIGAANTWLTSYAQQASGNVNVLNTLNATWQITGVQLEAGSVATPFERRDYGRELMICQRYYARLTAGTGTFTAFGAGTFGGASQGNIYLKYPTTMRASPTFSQSNCAVSDGPANIAVSSVSNFFGGSDSSLVTLALASSGTQYRGATLVANNNTAAFIDFSAEL